MRWQRLIGLKDNEIILLSYIYKYHRIDLTDLQRELDISVGDISLIVQKLYSEGYICYSGENNKRMSISVTDKIEKKYIDDWDKWTKVNVEKMEKEENFLSDILYIPKKIDII